MSSMMSSSRNSVSYLIALFVTIILATRCRLTYCDQVAPVYVPEGGSPLGDDLDFAESGPAALLALPTVTVRGFLNFRTTVDGTVIVFTPASEVPPSQPAPTQSRPAPAAPTKAPTLNPSPLIPSPSSGKDGNVDIQELDYSQNQADLAKKTPPEVSQETFKEINAVFPSSENIVKSKIQPTVVAQPGGKATKLEASIALNGQTSSGQYPTGLVTVLGGTNVEGGATTIHETKVIGTYIDGKYAQILQSTSRIILGSSQAATKEPTYVSTQVPETSREIKPSPSSPKVPISTSSPAFVFTSRGQRERNNQVSSSTASFPRSRTEVTKDKLQDHNDHRSQSVHKKGDEHINSNTVLQSSFRIPTGADHHQRSGAATQSLDSFRPISSGNSANRVRPTPSLVVLDDENTLSGRNGGGNRRVSSNSARLRYILPRRQSQTVRLNRFKVKLTVRPDQSISPEEQEQLSKHGHHFDDETDEGLSGVDLSGLDPNKVVFQRTTITSEITLHVGRRKSVRTITITTSVPRAIDGSEFESNGIIDPTEAAAHNALVATATPIGSEAETPALIISRNKRTDLITLSRTYSTTERVWRTSVVPYFDGQATTSHTVTESFFIRKIITAYKTMPPFDVDLTNDTDTDPVPTLDSNQSYQTDLFAGVQPLPPSPQQQLLQTPLPQQGGLPHMDPSYLQLASSSGGTLPLDYSNPLLSLGAALSQNPLAAVYLGLHQLNRQQQVTQYSTVTKTSSYTTTDTVYSTKVVRLYDGRQTRFRTLSESLSTTERVITTYSTTVEPVVNTQILQQQQQLQQLIGHTQLIAPTVTPPKTSTITSSYTTVTTATSYSTKIYTLIYNAFSTKYRTVTSTSTYPTTVTTFSTSEVTVQATVAPTLTT